MIRNRFTTVTIGVTPVTEPSFTIPDQTLTIKQIFDRYQVNTSELLLMARLKSEKDPSNIKTNDLIPDLDANQVYEVRKRLAAKYHDPSLINKVIPATDTKEPSPDIPTATE